MNTPPGDQEFSPIILPPIREKGRMLVKDMLESSVEDKQGELKENQRRWRPLQICQALLDKFCMSVNRVCVATKGGSYG